MSKMHLKQPIFTCSGCGKFNKILDMFTEFNYIKHVKLNQKLVKKPNKPIIRIFQKR